MRRAQRRAVTRIVVHMRGCARAVLRESTDTRSPQSTRATLITIWTCSIDF